MKAAVLAETGKPLEIREEIKLSSLNEGQVLVKMLYAGVCHSQLAEVRGWRGDDPYVPHLLGHEGVGLIEAVGEGVSKVIPGDKVVLGWIKGQGKDANGALYHDGEQVINSGGVTTFSESTVVAENRVVKLPQGMPDKLAVLLGCALPTGTGLVFNEAELSGGENVAVFGMGGIGLSALIAAQTTKPEILIAIDTQPEKLALARELGATHVINAQECDPVAAVFDICPGGVDYSFEAGASTRTIEMAFEVIRHQGGSCIFASHPKEGDKIKLDPFAFHCGKQIKGSWGGGANPDRDIPKLVDLYKEGELKNIERLLSKEYHLDDINDALDDLENRKINRALITF